MAGTGRFPAGAEGPDTGGRTQKARVPDDWQRTATPRDTPRKQPIPLPAPNIIKQDPVVFHKSSVGLNEGGQRLSAPPLTSPTEPSPGLDILPWMENIPERLVQRLRWTQGTSPKVPSRCRQGRPNFLGQLSSCQLPTPFQHGGGGRHPTVWTKRGPRYAPTRAVWSSLHGSKAGPSGLHWRRTQLQDMVHPAPHTKTGGSHPGARAHSKTLWGLPHLDQAARLNLMMPASSF